MRSVLKRAAPIVRIRFAQPMPLLARTAFGFEILLIYASVWLMMRRWPLDRTLAHLRRPRVVGAPVATRHRRATCFRSGRAVVKFLHLLPTDKRCLIRSLVLTGVLSRRQIDTTLVLGVRERDAERFRAHAWVEYEGWPVLPTEGYERLHAL